VSQNTSAKTQRENDREDNGTFGTHEHTAPEVGFPFPVRNNHEVTYFVELADITAVRDALDARQSQALNRALSGKIHDLNLGGVAHTLKIVDNECDGEPFWEPQAILDSNGDVLLEIGSEDEMFDDAVFDNLFPFTNDLGMFGTFNPSIQLDTNDHAVGITLTAPAQ
jgi:hypothetical protein